MASVPALSHNAKKLSFAKVAASASKDAPPTSSSARTAGPAVGKDRQDPRSSAPKPSAMAKLPATTDGGTTSPPAIVTSNPGPVGAAGAPNAKANNVAEALGALKLETKMPSLVVNGTGSASTGRSSKTGGNSQTPSDELSQKADSSSDLGTKPPSLDGKSITSGTTFNALDEKESLRPDDSASVKAAAEDDDAFSIRGSLIAGSRMGSDVAARVHRIQLGDMPPRTIISSHIIPESRSQGVATPQSGSSEQQPVTDAKIALVAATSTPDGLYRQNPDEKLLEAMQSPKDRLFLLRLEKQVIEFVQDSKEPFMDLPPCNSFCRMLTHKLADYYHMTHSFEAVAGAVRIFRTPFCRVPPSLASIATTTTNNTTPPALLPKKIMRRGEEAEYALGSGSFSKPTSEAGSDGKDKTAPAKEKLSREEREEAYKQARERIFGSSAAAEGSTPENDDGAGISRASSVSAVSRSRRKRRDDSESFDSRSAYTPFYGHPQQPTWVAPQYIPVGNQQFNGQVQQPYAGGGMQPPYGPPAAPAYPQVVPNPSFVPQYGTVPNYPPSQPSQQRYQGPPPTVAMPPYAPPPPVQTTPPQQPWPQPGFNQSPYQSRATPATPGIPYAYGQLPANANPNDPKSQHPIPGSYNGNYIRHGFNPKTQSFVPGTGMPPMPPPPPPPPPPAGPFNGYGPQQANPQVSPHMAYTGYQPPMGQAPYAGSGSGYGMMRQGSNSSIPSYHNPPLPIPPVQHGVQHPLPPHLPPNPHIPNKPAVPQGPSQAFSHLPNYGNPATLPQKPST